MGNAMTTEETIQQLMTQSNLEEIEIRRLHRRFRKIDTDKSGALSVEEFMAIPQLLHNPLVKRVVDIFDDDKNGQVDFQEFIIALSIFTGTDPFVGNDGSNRSRKIDFMFKIYDFNNDGFISNGDLYHVLKIMVGDNLNDVQLQQLVDRTIALGDEDFDGKLSYDEFVKMVEHSNIESKLTLEM